MSKVYSQNIYSQIVKLNYEQFICKLRTGIIILMLVGFWGISVSGVNHCLSDRPTACSGLSESDGGEKSFPQGHPNRMEQKKVFRGAIRIGWSRKKFSARPSESDGAEKSFPRGHPNRMEQKKVFRGAIRIGWTLLTEKLRSIICLPGCKPTVLYR